MVIPKASDHISQVTSKYGGGNIIIIALMSIRVWVFVSFGEICEGCSEVLQL
jgi:hypothetical protein